MGIRESLNQPVTDFMSAAFAKVEFDESVSGAAKIMMKARTTEAVVMRDDGPIGIITERDILYKVVADGLDPSRIEVREIMSAPVATVDINSKVADAIAKMSRLGVRRLGVTRRGKLVGLITQKAMVSGELIQNVALPELASPHILVCPYCGASIEDPKGLSRHIDRAHVGGGLLEGDVSKW